MKHAEHIVEITLNSRYPRMSGGDHGTDHFVGRLFQINSIHLSARHHQVICAQAGNLERALHHREGIRSDQTVRARFRKCANEVLFSVAGIFIGTKGRGQPVKKAFVFF